MVVRHATAETFAGEDVDRVLTDRGRADARALGEWLRDEGIVAEAACVSYAARTRETWQILAEVTGWDVDPQVDGALYGTDEYGALDIVRDNDDAVRTVVVVGHNPTIAMLAQLLDDGDGVGGELTGFPTGAAGVFEIDCGWAELAPMCARLASFHVGRAGEA